MTSLVLSNSNPNPNLNSKRLFTKQKVTSEYGVKKTEFLSKISFIFSRKYLQREISFFTTSFVVRSTRFRQVFCNLLFNNFLEKYEKRDKNDLINNVMMVTI